MAAKTKTNQSWSVEFHDEFDQEFDELDEDVQDNLLAAAKAVELLGPQAGRPHVDTLKGSKHGNMKELRFEGNKGNEEWRAAFAFDSEKRAVVLAANSKQGVDEKRFYKRLIKVADRRFDTHQARLKSAKKPKG